MDMTTSVPGLVVGEPPAVRPSGRGSMTDDGVAAGSSLEPGHGDALNEAALGDEEGGDERDGSERRGGHEGAEIVARLLGAEVDDAGAPGWRARPSPTRR